MKTGIDIAFFGSSLVSAYWNGAATYYRGIIRALHRQGHRITFFEPKIYDRQEHRDIPDPEWARVIVYSATENGVLDALESAKNAQLVVKASGVGLLDELLEREVLRLKDGGAMVVFWDVDAPATLDRMHSNENDPFCELVPRFDLIFTYGGGDPVVEAYRRLGARECIPIYNALDPDVHHPVAPDPRFDAELAFLGNRLPDRESRVDEFFFLPAKFLKKKKLLLGGNGWESKPKPENVNYLGHIYTRDHNAFNCTPRVVLNINRESMARYGFSPPTRIFEAAGAGACLISDAWQGIEMFLEPGREILTVQNGEALVDCLASLAPERAKRMGEAALKRVRAEHTYSHRAIQIEKILNAAGFAEGVVR